jgi:uncharacterized membrane protein
MGAADDNPYRSPQEPGGSAIAPEVLQGRASPAAAAIAVLCCLAVHACLWVRWEYFRAEPRWLDGIDVVLLLSGVLLGVPCGIFAIRRGRAVTRAVGTIGVVYFAYYVLRAIAES